MTAFGSLSSRSPLYDGARSVAYRFQVIEGPQYRMGDLTINGLPEVEANDLRGRWRLLHGDVFDTSYPDEFIKKGLPEFMKDAVHAGRPLPAMKVGAKMTPDRDKHTVDVTLEFKPDAPATKSPQTGP